MKRTLITALMLAAFSGNGFSPSNFAFTTPAYAGGGGGEANGTQFVELDPLVLPIVDNNGVSQTVSMIVSLEVHSEEAAETIKKMKPKLLDAYIQNMYGMLSYHATVKGGVMQVGEVKKKLNLISTEVLGEHVVEDVLLQFVQQRPI